MNEAAITIAYLKKELDIAIECNDTPEYINALKEVIQVISDCNE